MKKRFLPIFLVVVMLIGLVPFGSINVFASMPACEIEETGSGYNTLQEAIDAVADNQTIKVNQDLTCSTLISINNGKTFTIDFNDGSTQHSFTWMGLSSMTSNQDIFTVEANSNVTVKNMNYLVGENVIGNRIFKVNATGTLLLSNMYCAKDNKIQDTPVVNNGGTVVIDGGNIDITNAQSLTLLNPVVQNLGGTTTFKGNGIYTTQANTGAAWLGRVITMNNDSTDDDLNKDCGTVTIENGTFSGGHILDVNGSGIVVINGATSNSGTGPIIKVFHGGIKSNITVENITTSSMVFAQVIEELQTKIDFQDGNVKYTPSRFCVDGSGYVMNSVSIKNGKFGPKSGAIDIHDEINNLLASGSTLTALSGDSDGYTYKVETSTPPAHTHTFTYTANGAKVTATCTSGCDKGYDSTPLTLTLTAPSSLVYDGNAKEFTVAGGEGDAWTNAGLSLPTITYSAKSGSTLTDAKAVNTGSYTASITVDTNKTATSDFAITKATPYIKTTPEPTDINLGDKLSASTLAGGYAQISSTDSTQVGGLFEWADPDTTPAIADSDITLYNVTFTPDDANNFNTVSCQVTVTVNSSHTHNLVKVDGQDATETASGWKDYYECKDSTDACHMYFEDSNGNTPITDLEAWKAEGGNGYIAKLNAPKYGITVLNDGNGTANASVSEAASGTTVTLTATPASGYVFDAWEVVSGGITITGDTFTMPANAVEIKAKFKSTTPTPNPPKTSPKSKPEPQVNYLDPLDEMFEAAITSGSTDTIYWDKGAALPNYIMKLLFENPSLSLDFKFTYEGVEHEIYIGPGQATDDDIEWYGPLWLLDKYGEKKDIPAIHGTYTIVKGDTLNKLAAKFNTTVDELMRLNPYIEDRNKIYPGRKLNY